MIERISLSFDFENVFISISLDISDIEVKKDSNINELENFNVNIQIYLIFKKEYKEFTIIKVNFNTIRNNNEEYQYNKDDFYLEFNNTGYNNIIQINCIYNYYTFYLRFKVINNFFFKTMFKLIKKMYKEEKTRY